MQKYQQTGNTSLNFCFVFQNSLHSDIILLMFSDNNYKQNVRLHNKWTHLGGEEYYFKGSVQVAEAEVL